MKKKLILFDVDGILVKSVSTGAITSSIKKHFGLDARNTKVKMEARTYRWIFVERLKEVGIKNPESHEKFETAMRDPSPLADYVKEGPGFEKIAGVENLIKRLISQKHVLALLTGNSPESSRLKLESVGLWKYFKFGAFGSETLIRSKLVPMAIKEAEKEAGIKFAKGDVFIIGDTHLDVECAKQGRVKSIAVATGSVSLEELEKEKPDFAFKDFSNIGKILKTINS